MSGFNIVLFPSEGDGQKSLQVIFLNLLLNLLAGPFYYKRTDCYSNAVASSHNHMTALRTGGFCACA